MIQIYFMSIVVNVLAGYALIAEDKDTPENGLIFLMKDETIILVLGILSLVTGVLKLLSPIEGNIPVLGDFLPAATGLTSGIVLVHEYYMKKSTIGHDPDEKFGFFVLLAENRKIIGYAAITSAILHFLLPKVFLF